MSRAAWKPQRNNVSPAIGVDVMSEREEVVGVPFIVGKALAVINAIFLLVVRPGILMRPTNDIDDLVLVEVTVTSPFGEVLVRNLDLRELSASRFVGEAGRRCGQQEQQEGE
jgi:hypothetical protein